MTCVLEGCGNAAAVCYRCFTERVARLKAEREDVTKVSVRVGTFGDKTRTEMIFKEIDQQLGAK